VPKLGGILARLNALHVGREALQSMYVPLHDRIGIEEAGGGVVLLDSLPLHGPQAAASAPVGPSLAEVEVKMPFRPAHSDVNVHIVCQRILAIACKLCEVG